jgi:hypothetical protein
MGRVIISHDENYVGTRGSALGLGFARRQNHQRRQQEQQ